MEPQAAQHQVTLALSLPHHPDPTSPIPDDRPPSSVFRPLSSPLCPSPSLDGRAIQQALVNLIDNAIKHAPPNSSVEIGLTFDPPTSAPESAKALADGSTRASLRVWVRDSGEGIPASEHEKIFEPFYRRGTELRRETTGIGIGLSIVKHVVEAHSGRVTVDSETGRGSTFTIHIP